MRVLQGQRDVERPLLASGKFFVAPFAYTAAAAAATAAAASGAAAGVGGGQGEGGGPAVLVLVLLLESCEGHPQCAHGGAVASAFQAAVAAVLRMHQPPPLANANEGADDNADRPTPRLQSLSVGYKALTPLLQTLLLTVRVQRVERLTDEPDDRGARRGDNDGFVGGAGGSRVHVTAELSSWEAWALFADCESVWLTSGVWRPLSASSSMTASSSSSSAPASLVTPNATSRL